MANGSTLQREMTRKQDELVAIRGELETLQRQRGGAGMDGGSDAAVRERIAELESRLARVRRETEAIRQMAASFNEPLDERPSARERTMTPPSAPPPRQEQRTAPRPTTRIPTSELREPPPRGTQPEPPRSMQPPPSPPLPGADMDTTTVLPIAPRFCGQCGSSVNPGDDFCMQCGAPTAGSAAAPPPRPVQSMPPRNIPTQHIPPQNVRPAFIQPPPPRAQPIRATRPTAQSTPFGPGAPLDQMAPTVLLALFGVVALIGGLFAPLMHVSLGVFGQYDFNLYQFAFKSTDDSHVFLSVCWFAVVAIAGATLIAVFGRLYPLLWATGLGAAGVVAAAFIYYESQITSSSALAQALVNLSWGWAVLAIGAVLILGAAATTVASRVGLGRPSR